MTSNTHSSNRSLPSRAGFTLVEMMVVVAVLSALVLVATSSMVEGNRNAQLKSKVREIADLLQVARAEAIRTGNNQVIYFGNPGTTDPSLNPVEVGGNWVPVLHIDDGPPATADCAIAGPEIETWVAADVNGLNWGVSGAGTKVPADAGAAPFNPGGPPLWDGTTFADPAGAKINWVMFRPDGIPRVFSGAIGNCGTVGAVGDGGGAFYVTNGERDYSVVLTPLGGIRVHLWNGSNWSS
jgi:prepilin-type N-terminal cleavage/methylation domain-containing protein